MIDYRHEINNDSIQPQANKVEGFDLRAGA